MGYSLVPLLLSRIGNSGRNDPIAGIGFKNHITRQMREIRPPNPPLLELNPDKCQDEVPRRSLQLIEKAWLVNRFGLASELH